MRVFWWAISILGAGVFLTLAANFVARSPSDLESIIASPTKPTKISVPDAPKAEQPPPPETAAPEPSLLSTLAPESFSSQIDPGGGVGFGSGGNGPGIGGGGGFGASANQLVNEKSSIDRPPRPVARTAPEYPPEARTRGVSGFVELKILIGVSGSIDRVEVASSQPPGFFDQAALQSIRQWRFEPALAKGKAIAAWTKQKIKFELN